MKYLKLLFSILLCEAVGIAGAAFTMPAVTSWYKTLNKPFFSPPSWLFGPVWTLLYLAMGIALFLILEKGKKIKRQDAIFIFVLQLALNFLWSVLFFGLHSPVYGLLDILVLWAAIYMTIRKFYALSKPAAHLLVPYLLWVSFATLLNAAIVVLNR